MREIRFDPDGAVPDDKLAYAVMLARYHGKWIFCRHRQRSTYECPGGHREPGEEIDAAARRELHEETGAVAATLRTLGAYSTDGGETFGMLYAADVTRLGPLPEGSEIEQIFLLDELPDRWTYPDIQPRLFQILKEDEAKRQNG